MQVGGMYQDCQRHNNGARLLTLYLKLLQLISAAERIREGEPKVWVPCASGNVSNIKLIMYVARTGGIYFLGNISIEDDIDRVSRERFSEDQVGSHRNRNSDVGGK